MVGQPEHVEAEDIPRTIFLGDHMPLLPWDNALYTGIPAADREHRKLIDLANRLYAGSLRGGILNPAKLLDDLINVFSAHFAHEDRLMQECNYGQRELHAGDHQKLLEEIRQISTRAAGGTEYDFVTDLRPCLQKWLLSHITRHDLPMYRALQSALPRDHA